LQVVVARRSHRDQHCAQRLESRALQSAAASEEAVDVLSAAVGGKERIPVVTDEKRSTQLAAAVEVARHTGLPVDDVSLTRAADEVESGRDPLTAVAAACGARIRTVTLAQRWWQTEGNPLIVMLRDESRAEVAQAAVWRRGWVLIDPLSGKQQPITEELAERIERKATELLPVLPAAPTGIRQLARLALRGSRREIIAILAVTALLAAMSFVTPFLMGQIANLFIASSPRSAYVGLFGAMLLVVIAGISWQAVRALAMLRARSQAAAVSAGAVWERVMRQRATWHSQRSLGDRSAQASAVNNASAALPDETVARLLDTAAVLGSLAAIATTGSAMLVSLTAVLAGQMLVMLWLLRAASKRASQRVEAAAEATGRLMELLRAVNRLRVAGAEARAFLRWAQVQAPFSRADQSLRRITMLQGVVIAMWPVLALVVVVWVTAATSGSFGGFVTAQTAAATATTAIAAMALSANGTLVARQSLLKARPALESVPEGGGQGSQPGVLSGGMEVRELVFRYAPDLPTALDHVTFTVRPGEHVAIIGPSGCGKTTLMRILLGLEDPESGVISVDGKDLASLDRPAVRRQIGSVLQSSTLLPCTIKENIDMGRAMSHEEVWAALDAAAVGDDIRAMAMGLDTPVTDGGGTLSGGQRQRILIARALAGSPRMLILDEATSALDNLTQAAVVDALNGLRITRIVVAHRLSTVREADRIIVMDKGRVVDEGSYDALMAKDGPFRELALRQQA
jgi:ABC-type bacteriocin/lantibiotic exporter with double-glycine peptidase domain